MAPHKSRQANQRNDLGLPLQIADPEDYDGGEDDGMGPFDRPASHFPVRGLIPANDGGHAGQLIAGTDFRVRCRVWHFGLLASKL